MLYRGLYALQPASHVLLYAQIAGPVHHSCVTIRLDFDELLRHVFARLTVDIPTLSVGLVLSYPTPVFASVDAPFVSPVSFGHALLKLSIELSTWDGRFAKLFEKLIHVQISGPVAQW